MYVMIKGDERENNTKIGFMKVNGRRENGRNMVFSRNIYSNL